MSHIDKKSIELLKFNLLSDTEKSAMLDHMAYCKDCMAQFVQEVDGFAMITPRVNIAAAVAGGILDYKKEEKQKRKQVAISQYFKLAVAVCLTMAIFWGSGLSLKGSENILTAPSKAPANGVTTQKQEFSPKANNNHNLFEGFNSWFSEFAFNLNTANLRGENKNVTK